MSRRRMLKWRQLLSEWERIGAVKLQHSTRRSLLQLLVQEPDLLEHGLGSADEMLPGVASGS